MGAYLSTICRIGILWSAIGCTTEQYILHALADSPPSHKQNRFRSLNFNTLDKKILRCAESSVQFSHLIADWSGCISSRWRCCIGHTLVLTLTCTCAIKLHLHTLILCGYYHQVICWYGVRMVDAAQLNSRALIRVSGGVIANSWYNHPVGLSNS